MNKRFRLSDDSVNTHGFRILTAGLNLDQFRKNPVMLYDHDDYRRLPIGRWENIAIEADGALYADAVFDLKDPFAAQIAQKVEDGILNMVSIGARSIEESDDPAYIMPGQRYATITKSVLREASIVPFGSNYNSLVLYDGNNKRIELNENTVAQIFSPIKTDVSMKEVNKKLNLSESASESDAVQAIQAIETRAANAEAQLKVYQDAEKAARLSERKSLLDTAQSEGRILAEARPSWEKQFDADHEAAKTILMSIPKRTTAKDVVEQGEAAKTAEAKLLEMSYTELDKSGKLLEVKRKHPDHYKELFKAEFGKYPN